MVLVPLFLDCEASSFSERSYPVSVAWSNSEGTIQRCLISPASIPDWTDWDPASEAVHGIDRQRLERNGWSPAYVVERLVEDLDGATVHSDAPDFDGPWLRRLFLAATSRTRLPFTLAHVDDLLLPLVQRSYEMQWQAQNRLDKLKEHVRTTMTGAHDAGYDVGYLIQLHRAAQGLPVKMNHGIGPLPPTTATGTFERLKKPRSPATLDPGDDSDF